MDEKELERMKFEIAKSLYCKRFEGNGRNDIDTGGGFVSEIDAKNSIEDAETFMKEWGKRHPQKKIPASAYVKK